MRSDGNRRFPIRRFALLVATVIACVVGWQFWRQYARKRDAHYTASCANHFIQLGLGLRVLAHNQPDSILPATADTRLALAGIGTDYFGPLDAYGSACPESFLRDESIGYVYVGDGLRLREIEEKRILILFCPGENHRGSSDHGHAYTGYGTDCPSNEQMIGLLEQALARGESGEVAYSERAMKVLRSELAKRLSPAE